jgi:hypothetical protein
MSAFASVNGRFAISVRINFRFALVLVLLVAVAGITGISMTSIERSFTSYGSIAEDALAVEEINVEVAELHQQVPIFTMIGSADAQSRVDQLGKNFHAMVQSVIPNYIADERRAIACNTGDIPEECIRNFAKVIELRTVREDAVTTKYEPAALSARDLGTEARYPRTAVEQFLRQVRSA